MPYLWIKSQYLIITTQQILVASLLTIIFVHLGDAQVMNDTIKKDSITTFIAKDSLLIEQSDKKSIPPPGIYRSMMEWKLISRKAREAAKKSTVTFKCPQHPSKIYYKEGKCPDCNSLLIQNAVSNEMSDTNSFQHKHPE